MEKRDQVPVGTGRRTEKFQNVVVTFHDVVILILERRNEILRRRNFTFRTS